MIKRELLNLTDNELYMLSRCIESHLISRETYFNKSTVIIFNNLVKKVCLNGLKRKNPKKILHPIMDFEDD